MKDYKEKYEQALERAGKELQEYIHKDCDDITRRTAITIIHNLFPELQESKDERIRKGIIRNLEYLADRAEGFVKDELKERIAWLEKQGEQKTTDKTKFKDGDYIVPSNITPLEIWRVISIDEDGYYNIQSITNHDDDEIYRVPAFTLEKDYRLWTIQDAKDGDVLVNSEGQPFIFSGKYDEIHFDNPIAYCGVNCQNKFKIGNGTHWTSKNGVAPATKEQRDLLFQKIKEAGYKWDAYKKELKKIEQQSTDNVEPKFKVGNWYQCTKDFFGKGVTFDKNTAYYCAEEGCLQDEYGCHIAIVKDLYDNFKLWAIQDAKDGDVLFHSDSASNGIFIFKEILQRGTIQEVVCYCDYDSEDGFCLGEKHTCCWTDSKILHPASKEQRDLLFQKMKEAGYKWNSEKKELKKIEPKFKVGDWITGGYIYYKITEILDDRYIIESKYNERSAILFEYENRYHLWSINDAKDGDVLHSIGIHGDCIFIFNGLDKWKFDEPNGDRAVATGYCCLILSANNMEFGIQGPDCIEVDTVKPATKEQHDLLFEEMTQAGYEWDAEKKEMRRQTLKITPKFCDGQLITDNNGTWYKITNIKCLDDWYYEVYDIGEDKTHLELCSNIDEKFREWNK